MVSYHRKPTQPADDRYLLEGILCSISSGSTRDVGLLSAMRWFALHRWDSVQFMDREHYRVVGGISRLVDAMAADAGCQVRLNTPVASVRAAGAGVTVVTRAGEEFSARMAVLAVPLAALGAIDLALEVPDAWRAIASEGVASRGVKVSIRARPAASVFAVGSESMPLTWLITEGQDDDEMRLVAFGPSAERLRGNDVSDVQAAVSCIAAGIEVLTAESHDWLADEFARGTLGFLRPTQLTRLIPQLQEPSGRAVLAGADIAQGWVCFISGAIESGIRAGRLAHAALR